MCVVGVLALRHTEGNLSKGAKAADGPYRVASGPGWRAWSWTKSAKSSNVFYKKVGHTCVFAKS